MVGVTILEIISLIIFGILLLTPQIIIFNKVKDRLKHEDVGRTNESIKDLHEFNTKIEYLGMTYYVQPKTLLFHRIMMRLFFGIKISKIKEYREF